jgi:septal ring factor EnvC (AmiA/AmiB activator)
MKLSGILLIIMFTMGGMGYWYYTDTQNTIAVLTSNNAKLEMAVATNEATIKTMAADFAAANAELKRVNSEFAAIRKQNNRLASKLADFDLALLAASKPESIERAVNRGSANASRCFELLSGAKLTDSEKEAENGDKFNKECPWLYDNYKSSGMLNDTPANTNN